MNKRFQRHIEDFICGNCGVSVVGDGYTNHCPECLWSRHVDVNPGDRAETCHGLMEPIGYTQKQGVHVITHQCTVCGVTKRNKASKNDNFDTILSLQGVING
ncbi:RNHCP domain-containing protein [Candidatus Poribacteria bacterium]|nr:RNHCP domain-containing protein [Candidatus Poribacteria bacterium]